MEAIDRQGLGGGKLFQPGPRFRPQGQHQQPRRDPGEIIRHLRRFPRVFPVFPQQQFRKGLRV